MLFFTYGTLMQGQERHSAIAQFNPTLLSDDARVRGIIHNFHDKFPVIDHGYADDNWVYGELYEFDDNEWQQAVRPLLDDIEGHPTLFTRASRVVRYNNEGQSHATSAVVYEGNAPMLFTNNIIETGRWE